jgi:hypothetical protein
MEYHEPTPSILLVHDGELADLAAVIEPLGGIDRRGNPTDSDRSQTWDVVVASASRMLELHQHLPRTSATRIAVLDGDSKTLRKLLHRVETDLLVRQPVHPVALRLLILHALYRGPEKRRTTRVSVGTAVRFRVGLRRRTALLAELSTRGCRILADPASHRAAPDKRLTIALPPEITGDNRALSLRGHVVRVSRAEEGADVIAVVFELLPETVRSRLASIVSAHSQGPAVLDEAVSRALHPALSIPQRDEPQTSDPAKSADPAVSRALHPALGIPTRDEPQASDPAKPAAEAVLRTAHPAPSIRQRAETQASDHDDPTNSASSERRVQERHAITRRIIALSDEAARVLIGRDLSIGGMRIDPTPALALGDRLKVAVHVRSDGQPLVVSAEIVRDDGPNGMALRFVDLSAAARSYLSGMVGTLPDIIDPNRSQERSGVVVSEVIQRRAV